MATLNLRLVVWYNNTCLVATPAVGTKAEVHFIMDIKYNQISLCNHQKECRFIFFCYC